MDYQDVQGKACLDTSFSTFSIKASAHPVTVLCVEMACGRLHVWVKEHIGNDKRLLGEWRWMDAGVHTI